MKNSKPCLGKTGVGIVLFAKCLERGLLSNNLSSVHKLSFAYMRTMPYMGFTRCRILAQGYCFCLIVCPSLGASLLRVTAFWIWHLFLF